MSSNRTHKKIKASSVTFEFDCFSDNDEYDGEVIRSPKNVTKPSQTSKTNNCNNNNNNQTKTDPKNVINLTSTTQQTTLTNSRNETREVSPHYHNKQCKIDITNSNGNKMDNINSNNYNNHSQLFSNNYNTSQVAGLDTLEHSFESVGSHHSAAVATPPTAHSSMLYHSQIANNSAAIHSHNHQHGMIVHNNVNQSSNIAAMHMNAMQHQQHQMQMNNMICCPPQHHHDSHHILANPMMVAAAAAAMGGTVPMPGAPSPFWPQCSPMMMQAFANCGIPLTKLIGTNNSHHHHHNNNNNHNEANDCRNHTSNNGGLCNASDDTYSNDTNNGMHDDNSNHNSNNNNNNNNNNLSSLSGSINSNTRSFYTDLVDSYVDKLCSNLVPTRKEELWTDEDEATYSSNEQLMKVSMLYKEKQRERELRQKQLNGESLSQSGETSSSGTPIPNPNVLLGFPAQYPFFNPQHWQHYPWSQFSQFGHSKTRRINGKGKVGRPSHLMHTNVTTNDDTNKWNVNPLNYNLAANPYNSFLMQFNPFVQQQMQNSVSTQQSQQPQSQQQPSQLSNCEETTAMMSHSHMTSNSDSASNTHIVYNSSSTNDSNNDSNNSNYNHNSNHITETAFSQNMTNENHESNNVVNNCQVNNENDLQINDMLFTNQNQGNQRNSFSASNSPVQALTNSNNDTNIKNSTVLQALLDNDDNKCEENMNIATNNLKPCCDSKQAMNNDNSNNNNSSESARRQQPSKFGNNLNQDDIKSNATDDLLFPFDYFDQFSPQRASTIHLDSNSHRDSLNMDFNNHHSSMLLKSQDNSNHNITSSSSHNCNDNCNIKHQIENENQNENNNNNNNNKTQQNNNVIESKMDGNMNQNDEDNEEQDIDIEFDLENKAYDIDKIDDENDNNNDNENENENENDINARCRLPDDALDVLREWFQKNVRYPYPKQSEKEELAQQTNLSVKQVNTWFTNTRKRVWQPCVDSLRKQQEHRRRYQLLGHEQNVRFTYNENIDPKILYQLERCRLFPEADELNAEINKVMDSMRHDDIFNDTDDDSQSITINDDNNHDIDDIDDIDNIDNNDDDNQSNANHIMHNDQTRSIGTSQGNALNTLNMSNQQSCFQNIDSPLQSSSLIQCQSQQLQQQPHRNPYIVQNDITPSMHDHQTRINNCQQHRMQPLSAPPNINNHHNDNYISTPVTPPIKCNLTNNLENVENRFNSVNSRCNQFQMQQQQSQRNFGNHMSASAPPPLGALIKPTNPYHHSNFAIGQQTSTTHQTQLFPQHVIGNPNIYCNGQSPNNTNAFCNSTNSNNSSYNDNNYINNKNCHNSNNNNNNNNNSNNNTNNNSNDNNEHNKVNNKENSTIVGHKRSLGETMLIQKFQNTVRSLAELYAIPDELRPRPRKKQRLCNTNNRTKNNNNNNNNMNCKRKTNQHKQQTSNCKSRRKKSVNDNNGNDNHDNTQRENENSNENSCDSSNNCKQLNMDDQIDDELEIPDVVQIMNLHYCTT